MYKINDIVEITTYEESELDGELIFIPFTRNVKIIDIFEIDELGYEYYVQSLGMCKNEFYIRKENINKGN